MSEVDHHRGAVIRRLYAVLTARLEDATQLAVEGQSPDSAVAKELAHRLIDVAQETSAIGEAIVLLTEPASE